MSRWLRLRFRRRFPRCTNLGNSTALQVHSRYVWADFCDCGSVGRVGLAAAQQGEEEGRWQITV